MTEPVIEARDVRLSFGATEALRGASLAVNAGEVVAVMGPSGSGKSTLLHCLAGILVPDAGQVQFSGRRIDLLPESQRSALRRDRFGFVFQFGQLVPELTAEEKLIPVELNVEGDQGHTYKGTISSFDNRINVSSGTIRARARFANEDHALVPGMFVSVRLAGTSDATALLVPLRAIGSNQSKKFVYVADGDNKVAYREVTLGRQVGSGERIVLSGVQEGDRVIVDGVQHVKPGAPVEVREASAGNAPGAVAAN